MGQYDGGQAPVDSSNWKQDAATHRNGEPVPAPAPMQQTSNGMERTPTPDPYKSANSNTVRNFSRNPQ
jgi:hypothetical protein